MEVFWDKGYGATTPNDLVLALGIGNGSLYHEFGSKRALFERALERYRDAQAVLLIEVLQQPGPVKARLSAVLEALVDIDFAAPVRRGCMAVNTAAELGGVDEAATGLVREMFERTEQAFVALIEEGQRAGEIDAGRDPQAIGSLLLNTVVGLRVIAMVADGPARSRAIVRTVVEPL